MISECKCQEFSGDERMFWCETHQCWKTRQWQKLCQTNEKYRQAWADGRGPGQVLPDPSDDAQDENEHAPKLPRRPKGVGDHMKDAIAELGIHPKHGCGCDSLASEMNCLGPDRCRRDRARLVEKLKLNAQQYSWGDVARAVVNAVKTGLAWKINPLDPYGSLLDEAIRRAETAVA